MRRGGRTPAHPAWCARSSALAPPAWPSRPGSRPPAPPVPAASPPLRPAAGGRAGGRAGERWAGAKRTHNSRRFLALFRDTFTSRGQQMAGPPAPGASHPTPSTYPPPRPTRPPGLEEGLGCPRPPSFVLPWQCAYPPAHSTHLLTPPPAPPPTHRIRDLHFQGVAAGLVVPTQLAVQRPALLRRLVLQPLQPLRQLALLAAAGPGRNGAGRWGWCSVLCLPRVRLA